MPHEPLLLPNILHPSSSRRVSAAGIHYCTACGGPAELRENSGRVRPVCPACGHAYYFCPLVAVAAAIQRADGQVLIVKRGENPGRGLWGLPGGYVEADETLEPALTREILEETGLHAELRGILGVWSFFNDFKSLSGVVVIYRARSDEGLLQPGSDSTAALWVDPDRLADYPFAFESHKQALSAFRLAD